MRRLSKQERVQFEGRNLSLNTIKSYAGDKKHPLHSKAKVFLEKKNQKSWTQKVEERQRTFLLEKKIKAEKKASSRYPCPTRVR